MIWMLADPFQVSFYVDIALRKLYFFCFVNLLGFEGIESHDTLLYPCGPAISKTFSSSLTVLIPKSVKFSFIILTALALVTVFPLAFSQWRS